MRGEKVTLRDYVDRGLGDLARYHDAGITGLQGEIDRRLGEIQRETGYRLSENATARDALLARVERAEAALERQRGRAAAYAAVSVIAVTIVAVLTLVLNHVR
jgi:hypothetical protein